MKNKLSLKQKYIIGFIFNRQLDKILLLIKGKSPKGLDMTGKLNVPGGKLENNENPIDGIHREILEETNLDIDNPKWVNFCNLECEFGIVYCFYVVTDDIYKYKQVENEKLDIYSLNPNGGKQVSYSDSGTAMVDKYYFYYQDYSRMANLDYLIPIALNHYKGLDKTKGFEIKEIY